MFLPLVLAVLFLCPGLCVGDAPNELAPIAAKYNEYKKTLPSLYAGPSKCSWVPVGRFC